MGKQQITENLSVLREELQVLVILNLKTNVANR